MLMAAIPVKWALFFTMCLGMVILFVVIRKLVFFASEKLLDKMN